MSPALLYAALWAQEKPLPEEGSTASALCSGPSNLCLSDVSAIGSDPCEPSEGWAERPDLLPEEFGTRFVIFWPRAPHFFVWQQIHIIFVVVLPGHAAHEGTASPGA